MERTLAIDAEELYFSAAHYLPGYEGLCGHLHGHTYFVKFMRVTVEGFVDLTAIKGAVKSFDHMILIPECDRDAWTDLMDKISKLGELSKFEKIFGRQRMLIDSDVPGTTVEEIADALRDEIMDIPGVKEVHFTLYEGPIAGREI